MTNYIYIFLKLIRKSYTIEKGTYKDFSVKELDSFWNFINYVVPTYSFSSHKNKLSKVLNFFVNSVGRYLTKHLLDMLVLNKLLQEK